jgi:hypothetical protein
MQTRWTYGNYGNDNETEHDIDFSELRFKFILYLRKRYHSFLDVDSDFEDMNQQKAEKRIGSLKKEEIFVRPARTLALVLRISIRGIRQNLIDLLG